MSQVLHMNDAKPGDRLRDKATRIGKPTPLLASLASAPPGGRSLDAAKFDSAYVGIHTTLNDRYSQVPGITNQIATVVETENDVDRHVWLRGLPRMRDWLGDKVLHKLRAESLTITTTPKEASIEVPKRDILRDRLGMYRPKINALADSYDSALMDLAIAMLAAGIQGTALGTSYDGQNLIDTDHTILQVGGGPSQNNKVTGALTTATFNTAFTRYLGFVDETGTPINTANRRMKLVVGPNNREVARSILGAATLDGDDNLDKGAADLVVTPWISARTVVVNGVSVTLTGNEWFLLPENSAAVLIHVRQTPEFLSVEEGEFAFRTGIWLYGIEAEFGAGYGMWQDVVGGPGA